MKHVAFAKTALAVAALAAAMGGAQAGTLYIGGWNTGTVYSVDLTAQSVTPLVGGFSQISGMEGIGNDLYVFTQSNDVVSKIDPTTGATLTTYNLGALGINVTGEGTFAMHSDLTGFTSSSSGSVGTYYTFDLNANTATNIGTGISFDGVDYAPNGVLYGLTQSPSTPGGSELRIIDPMTGTTQLVGSTGISSSALAGLVVADGDFIAAIGSSLYRIDPFTAAPTFLFDAGIGDISGAAFLGSTNPGEDPNPNPMPEPMSLALLGLGLAGLGASRRFSKK
ncbi:PEP-CTERM sorting domain-containing protein [Denitromonas iodatirespirans]|uniref:PEP-CTERM sorting domain-containing protein n=1 Tax=Denitromonas iodatirespirans TaxID=2795389 RepID=A0A944DCZ7_DENI1|nr:PEP-CTERM sorting domain-containing protein [Denitromonas iodatirespirans]MBT0962796.1 PEP-CTERM sorting domain-containing protein [Denitromonas iodatirespirans]